MIGPTFEHSGLLKRDVVVASDNHQVKHRLTASSNPVIMVQRSVKQALNFLRLSLEREKI